MIKEYGEETEGYYEDFYEEDISIHCGEKYTLREMFSAQHQM